MRRPLPIYLIAGTSFAGGLARTFLVPLRAHELGASRLSIGLLSTVGLLVAAVISLPSGYLTDRLGPRVTVTASIALGIMSQAVAAAAPAVWPLYVSSVVGGIGIGTSQTALFAALAATVAGGRVGRAMGWLTFSMQAGFLCGPALAGLALSVVSTQADLGLVTLFWLAALPFAVGLSGGSRKGIWDWGASRAILARPGFQAVMLGTLALGMLWGTLQGYLPIFGKEALALPGSMVGYLLAIQAAANGVSRVLLGRVVDRFRRQWPLVVVGAIGTGLALIALPHLAGFAGPALLLALSVPFTATAFIALSVAFANLATDANRGLVMGVYSAGLFVGLGAGPAVFGPAMQASYTEGFTICGLTGIALGALVPLVRWAPRRQGAPIALPPAA